MDDEATTLPIRTLTLYKHGVGFVRRQGALTGEEVRLVFRANEVNDALKSLLVIDRAGVQVLGIHYDTPADRQSRLADCPITLGADHSLLDLLRGLRGSAVRLLAGADTAHRAYAGRLLGVEVPYKKAPLGEMLVAILDEATGAVVTLSLADLRQVWILEERAGQDLRFFLDSSQEEEAHHTVRVRLSAGEHDLAVSYLVPSPTWRVSYRLVAESEDGGGAGTPDGRLLLQGWGLFDNRLEEDLREVAVTLVAGQPISFIYDLASSRIPERPLVRDTARVAAGPVEFQEALPATVRLGEVSGAHGGPVMMAPRRAPGPPMAMAAMPAQAATIADLQSQTVVAAGDDQGELFAYEVLAPVTVKRGESALVPILGATLPYRRELLFNERKLPAHPVAALRFSNDTGLVLERGPVTVLEDGEYRGEALVPFSKEGAEVYLAFAVELGIAVSVDRSRSVETAGLHIANAMLERKQAVVTRTTYTLESSLAAARTVTIEHPREHEAALVETREPSARTAEWYRWMIPCSPRGATTFTVTQRRYTVHTQALLEIGYSGLAEYLHDRWLDRATYDRIAALLEQQTAIGANEREAGMLESERAGIYEREEQLRKNMAALAGGGEEGALRRQAVAGLRVCEERIASIDARQGALAADSARRQAAIDEDLAGLRVEGNAP